MKVSIGLLPLLIVGSGIGGAHADDPKSAPYPKHLRGRRAAKSAKLTKDDQPVDNPDDTVVVVEKKAAAKVVSNEAVGTSTAVGKGDFIGGKDGDVISGALAGGVEGVLDRPESVSIGSQYGTVPLANGKHDDDDGDEEEIPVAISTSKIVTKDVASSTSAVAIGENPGGSDFAINGAISGGLSVGNYATAGNLAGSTGNLEVLAGNVGGTGAGAGAGAGEPSNMVSKTSGAKSGKKHHEDIKGKDDGHLDNVTEKDELQLLLLLLDYMKVLTTDPVRASDTVVVRDDLLSYAASVGKGDFEPGPGVVSNKGAGSGFTSGGPAPLAGKDAFTNGAGYSTGTTSGSGISGGETPLDKSKTVPLGATVHQLVTKDKALTSAAFAIGDNKSEGRGSNGESVSGVFSGAVKDYPGTVDSSGSFSGVSGTKLPYGGGEASVPEPPNALSLLSPNGSASAIGTSSPTDDTLHSAKSSKTSLKQSVAKSGKAQEVTVHSSKSSRFAKTSKASLQQSGAKSGEEQEVTVHSSKSSEKYHDDRDEDSLGLLDKILSILPAPIRGTFESKLTEDATILSAAIGAGDFGGDRSSLSSSQGAGSGQNLNDITGQTAGSYYGNNGFDVDLNDVTMAIEESESVMMNEGSGDDILDQLVDLIYSLVMGTPVGAVVTTQITKDDIAYALAWGKDDANEDPVGPAYIDGVYTGCTSAGCGATRPGTSDSGFGGTAMGSTNKAQSVKDPADGGESDGEEIRRKLTKMLDNKKLSDTIKAKLSNLLKTKVE